MLGRGERGMRSTSFGPVRRNPDPFGRRCPPHREAVTRCSGRVRLALTWYLGSLRYRERSVLQDASEDMWWPKVSRCFLLIAGPPGGGELTNCKVCLQARHHGDGGSFIVINKAMGTWKPAASAHLVPRLCRALRLLRRYRPQDQGISRRLMVSALQGDVAGAEAWQR